MFEINDDMSIYVTRGDVIAFAISADSGGKNYTFHAGDILRIKVFEKKACENVVLEKVFPVSVESEKVEIVLTKEDTKIGDVISKPVDYWYEIELNPFTNPQTIIGYDDAGPKVFRLLPEGADADDKPGGGTYDFEIIGKFESEGVFFGWQVYSAAAVNEGFQQMKKITEELNKKLNNKLDKEDYEEVDLTDYATKEELETLRREVIGEIGEISALIGEVT